MNNDNPSLEPRVTALEKSYKELDDAMLVHAHLEARAARRIKEHAEFLTDHETAIQKHDQMMGELDTLMREISDKVNFIIDRDMKREGGPEAN